jgi:RND family efflux transporter MFP subunit
MVTARAILADSRTLAAQAAVAEQRLADTVIRAPGGGGEGRRYSVARRLVSEGEYVEPGHESFRLVSSDLIKYRAEIPERFAGSVRVGQTARVWVEAPGEPATGAVSRLAPNIDPESRTFLVEIRVDNKDGRLKPGAFARGRIVTHMDEGVVFVPEAAVVTFAGVHKVYSVRDGKAVEHRVRLGERAAGRVEVVGGLDVSEVVTEGAGALADGSPVRVNGS